MIKKKNRKLNLFGKKVKISNEAYELFEELSKIIQLHEISMIGWAKNCYDDETPVNDYETEFYNYVMSIPNATETIAKMEKIDQEREELKEKAKKVVEKHEKSEK